jgi:hypothetical protein
MIEKDPYNIIIVDHMSIIRPNNYDKKLADKVTQMGISIIQKMKRNEKLEILLKDE